MHVPDRIRLWCETRGRDWVQGGKAMARSYPGVRYPYLLKDLIIDLASFSRKIAFQTCTNIGIQDSGDDGVANGLQIRN